MVDDRIKLMLEALLSHEENWLSPHDVKGPVRSRPRLHFSRPAAVVSPHAAVAHPILALVGHEEPGDQADHEVYIYIPQEHF